MRHTFQSITAYGSSYSASPKASLLCSPTKETGSTRRSCASSKGVRRVFEVLLALMIKYRHNVVWNRWLALTDFTQCSNLSSSSTPLIRQMQQQEREDIAWLEGLRHHHQARQLGHEQVRLSSAFQAERLATHCCRHIDAMALHHLL